jgi:hypothetical protein
MKILVFLLFITFSFAKEITTHVYVDKNKITIGDKIKFTLFIKHSKKIQLNPIDVRPALYSFEIKDIVIKGPKKHLFLDKVSLSYQYILTSFTTGVYTIDSITISYKNKKGEIKEINTDKIPITIESVKRSPKDKDDIRDIKPPLSIPSSKLWYIITFLIFSLVISYFAYNKFFKKQKFVLEQVVEDTRPAYEIAYEELNKLNEMKLPEQGQVKLYYIKLSEIIRRYFEGQFKILALERTTSEIYRTLREIQFDKKITLIIKDLLDNCDLVKFAKAIPSQEIINEDFLSAKYIIDETKPKQQELKEEVE